MGSIIIIVAWQWIPFATLILITAMQSLDREQMEAARLDGAKGPAMFYFIILPHLLRPISVVVMIETIFLLSIFAEILVTTSGGPGHGDHEPHLLHLSQGAPAVGRGRRLGRRRHRHHPRQHRRGVPDPDRRPQPRQLRRLPWPPAP